VKLTTAGALLAEMQRAVKLLGLPAGSLSKVVAAIGVYLSKIVPVDPAAPLDAATRSLISAEFTKIATALGSL
jgi:hypothetical protein